MFCPPKPKLLDRATSTGCSLGLVRDVVEVAFRIAVFEIDGWGKHTIANGEEANNRFNTSGRGDQMAHHALGARDRNLVRGLAECPLDRQGFDRVVD